MKLTKVAVNGGRQKYVALMEASEDLSEKYTRVFRDGFVSMDMAQNILVIKTVSGMAMAVAAALDAMHLHEVVGCIAGMIRSCVQSEVYRKLLKLWDGCAKL